MTEFVAFLHFFFFLGPIFMLEVRRYWTCEAARATVPHDTGSGNVEIRKSKFTETHVTGFTGFTGLQGVW